jgi:hypothetical protein
MKTNPAGRYLSEAWTNRMGLGQKKPKALLDGKAREIPV